METPEEAYQLSNNVIRELIGKTVVDAYGWTVGKIIGVSTDSQDSVSLLGIELSNGGFMKYEASKAHYDQNAVVIDSSWRTKVERLTDEITIVTKRISALNGLRGEFLKEFHDDLENRFENEKKVLLEQRRSLSEQLEERMKAIKSQLNEVYEFVARIKISHHLGDIDEETYQRSNVPFQLMIDRLLSEENDIKFALDRLSANLLTLPPEPLKSLPPSKPDQPSSAPIRLRITDA